MLDTVELSLRAALPMLVVGVVICLVPLMSAPTVQFGVRIPAEAADAAVIGEQRRAYVWRTAALAACLTMAALLIPAAGGWVTPVLVLAEIAVGLGCYWLARARIVAVKDAEGWSSGLGRVQATAGPRADHEPFPWWWLLPAGAVIVATVSIGVAHYPHLPDQLGMHFDASGNPDRFAHTTPWTAFSLVFVQLFVTALIAGLLLITYRSRPELDAADLVGSTDRYRRYLATMARALLVLAALVDVTLLLGSLQMWELWEPRSPLALWAVVPALIGVVLVIVVAVRTGQAGSGLRGDDDRFWKAGVFYVNRHDPSLMVGKRLGVGWTLNFGNPWAWLIAAAIVTVIVIVVVAVGRA